MGKDLSGLCGPKVKFEGDVLVPENVLFKICQIPDPTWISPKNGQPLLPPGWRTLVCQDGTTLYVNREKCQKEKPIKLVDVISVTNNVVESSLHEGDIILQVENESFSSAKEMWDFITETRLDGK